MALIKLSVIIVNYNTREDLRACLTALHDCRPMPEIIVVDNASRDGSAAMVKQEFPRVVLLEPGHNTWFCGGNNLGVAAAHGEYALLLNPDTIPPPGALGLMVRYMDQHPAYAGVTMQLRYPNGEIQRTCSRIPTFRYLLLTQTPLQWIFRGACRKAQQQHWYEHEGWTRETDFDVEAVPGSCTLMRRDELHLNEELLLYFPEEDLAQQAGGRKFRFLSEMSIIHREKSATRSPLAMRIYFQDMITYTRRYHGKGRALLLWLASRPLKWGLEIRWAIAQRQR
ncbi:MAG: glycosyltransferase family 2 protein [Anaerolineae bacterium]